MLNMLVLWFNWSSTESCMNCTKILQALGQKLEISFIFSTPPKTQVFLTPTQGAVIQLWIQPFNCVYLQSTIDSEMLLPVGSPPVQCSSSVGFEPFQATGRLPTSQAQQHIVVNKTFSCYGRVTAWKMRVSNPDSDKWILMQVWRRVGEYFQQVGKNRINITNTSSFTDVVFHVDESEQILYHPGDFIGVFSVNGARALPYAIDLFSPNPLSSFVYSYRLIQSDYAPTQLAVNRIAMGIIPGVLADVAALTGQFYTSETLSQARFSGNTT